MYDIVKSFITCCLAHHALLLGEPYFALYLTQHRLIGIICLYFYSSYTYMAFRKTFKKNLFYQAFPI